MPSIMQLRREALAGVKGKILEIGFGTGLNLAAYPSSVQEICAIDPNLGMRARAEKHLRRSPIQVHFYPLRGETLFFPDQSFDTVVSTFTLCSIASIAQALLEIRRVLKDTGQLLFLEHGLSPEPRVQFWQHRLNGIEKCVGDGCNLDRNTPELIRQAGFEIPQLHAAYFQRFPKILTYLYRGVAQKNCLFS